LKIIWLESYSSDQARVTIPRVAMVMVTAVANKLYGRFYYARI